MIGIAAALLTFPVLAWSGSQFFMGAWNNFRNHNANVETHGLTPVALAEEVCIYIEGCMPSNSL
jgi:cation transport ATPase